MSNAVSYEVRAGVACLTLNLPPVNTLDSPLRQSLSACLETAALDPSVEAILISGQGRVFCGGANLAAFETDGLAEPTLHDTINRQIETLGKPVVAAIHGAALGGGLELALSCHYRLWQSGTRLGLPEITLGFMPGAGGTQKLPRAIGLLPALNLILSGRTALIEEYADTALADAVVASGIDFTEAALNFALECSARRPLPRLRDRAVDDPDAAALLQFARRNLGRGRGWPGSAAAIDAIARTVDGTAFDDAMRQEFTVFQDLAQRPEARALRYQFLAKSRVGKDKQAAAASAAPLQRAAVVGAGLMGSGIAFCLARAGLEVNLTDRDPAARERAFASIESDLARLRKQGVLDETAADALRSRIRWTEGSETLAGIDLALEAVAEDYDVKAQLLRWLDQYAPPHALIASNTSSLDLNALALVTRRPARVVGLHFFSPASLMPLVEVVRTAHLAPEALSTALALCRRLGKTPVIAGVCDGFIGNRMIERYTEQACALVEGGITPARIDAALERFGMAMGPFRMLDMVGNDIPWAGRLRRYASQPGIADSIADRLCERGWLGQKTGQGWYRHAPGQKRPQANPELPGLVEAYARERNIAPIDPAIDDATLVQRCVLALVNEGARLLDEGIAERAGDIDVVYTMGYGFPATRGGPMFHADEAGLVNVLRLMRRFAAADVRRAAFWEPAPLLLHSYERNVPLHTSTSGARS